MKRLIYSELIGRLMEKEDEEEMKERLGVKDSRPLADFLPTLTIVAKNLATEMTNLRIEEIAGLEDLN